MHASFKESYDKNIDSVFENRDITLPTKVQVVVISHGMRDLSPPTMDGTQVPMHWKHRILTTGLPGKSNFKLHKATI